MGGGRRRQGDLLGAMAEVQAAGTRVVAVKVRGMVKTWI